MIEKLCPLYFFELKNPFHFCLIQWQYFLPRGHLAMSKNIFECNYFRVEDYIGFDWGETIAAIEYPAIHRRAPPIKSYPAQNVNSATVKNSALITSSSYFCLPNILMSIKQNS